MIEIEGILISCNQYKDNDGILNVLTPNGYVSILGRGIYKYNNPNCFFANSLLIGKFECYKGKVGGLKLRTVDVIKNLTLDFYQYNSIVVLDSLKEILFKIKENNDYLSLYNELYDFLTTSTEESRFTDFLYFIYNLTIILGIKPSIEESFNYFDINNGKFIYKCNVNEAYSLTEKEIEAINCLDNGLTIKLSKEESKNLLVLFLTFISQYFDLNLNCICYFKK